MPVWHTPRPPSQNPAPPTLLIVAPVPSTARLLIPAAQALAILTLVDHTEEPNQQFAPFGTVRTTCFVPWFSRAHLLNAMNFGASSVPYEICFDAAESPVAALRSSITFCASIKD